MAPTATSAWGSNLPCPVSGGPRLSTPELLADAIEELPAAPESPRAGRACWAAASHPKPAKASWRRSPRCCRCRARSVRLFCTSLEALATAPNAQILLCSLDASSSAFSLRSRISVSSKPGGACHSGCFPCLGHQLRLLVPRNRRACPAMACHAAGWRRGRFPQPTLVVPRAPPPRCR